MSERDGALERGSIDEGIYSVYAFPAGGLRILEGAHWILQGAYWILQGAQWIL